MCVTGSCGLTRLKYLSDRYSKLVKSLLVIYSIENWQLFLELLQ